MDEEFLFTLLFTYFVFRKEIFEASIEIFDTTMEIFEATIEIFDNSTIIFENLFFNVIIRTNFEKKIRTS